jgi:hypothetical protein
VIKDAPFNIWAMAIHRVGGRFIMNHGSFTKLGVQNVLRFWESQDLLHSPLRIMELSLPTGLETGPNPTSKNNASGCLTEGHIWATLGT